jgi:predicted tellurium resistance membrane protein TerC
MEWMADPAVWFGLPTLVLLEIVLGVDNLIFIAILADKVPPSRRNAARQIGLGLALLIRLLLLASIFGLTRLAAPLFMLLGRGVSGRDLILLGGGVFLLLKATVEIHERLETETRDHPGPGVYGGFAWAVAQIVALDAVFSIDSILTAVGMTDQLVLMMAAVVIAMLLMIAASRPLTEFITAHPPLIILCLGFLLMVGFSLVADGLGFHIPKGYLYAAIGFGSDRKLQPDQAAESPALDREDPPTTEDRGSAAAPSRQRSRGIRCDYRRGRCAGCRRRRSGGLRTCREGNDSPRPWPCRSADWLDHDASSRRGVG